MKMLQYFIAFLVFLAGFAIIDANVNGAFRYTVIMGTIGLYAGSFLCRNNFLIKGLDKAAIM